MKPSAYLPLGIILISICGFTIQARAEIIEERGSLLEFFSGREQNCAYDNWLSHVSEGVVRAGYNDYGPVELDRQTNGFGDYQLLDSLPDPAVILIDWYRMTAHILAGNLDSASAILDSSRFSDPYELVHLIDGEEEYAILREVLDSTYFDDNGTDLENDDVTGSFRYGWGIFIFNLNPRTPQVVFEVPHPCDDFVAPHVGMDAFISMGAAAIFVNGAGREVKWTQIGAYDNSKSRSDPTRTMNMSVFQEAHKAIVDSIGAEFVIPIHSYDSGGRDLAQSLLSAYTDNFPDPPIIDRVNHFDILHLTPLFPIAANTIGNANHEAVRIDEYYAVWNVGDPILYDYNYVISSNMPNLNGWPSPQRNYSWDHRDTIRYFENYMHIEHDEFPDVIQEEVLDFYPPDGVPTYRTYANAVEFYRPLYQAVYDYYHNTRLRRVPEDLEGIQAAIDVSFGGDTIIVHPGEYRENINFRHKNLTISSLYSISGNTAHIDSTVISGNGEGSVVTFAGYENGSARLDGFTIKGGRSLDGAGIFMTDASPVIENCVITDNVATGFGGAIFCGRSSPFIINCTIAGNSSEEGGGALFLWNQSGPTLHNCIIALNEPEQVYFLRFGEPNLLFCGWSDILGGPGEMETGNNGEVFWLDGSIDADPLFLNPAAGNFHLSPLSPCVNAGHPDSPFDPDSTVADMGALPIRFRNIVTFPGMVQFSFHQPGEIDSMSLVIYNVGIDTISIVDWQITPVDGPFSVTRLDSAFTLYPDSSRTLWIGFDPREHREYRAVLTISSDLPGEEITVVGLHGSSLNVDSDEALILYRFELLSVYPNPFNSLITVRYFLPEASRVDLAIFDLSGREIERRAIIQPAGVNNFIWSAERRGSGLYMIRLQAGDRILTRKALLMK